MKRENRHGLLIAAALAFLLSWSTVQCLVTAFGLGVEQPEGLLLMLGGAALFCAILFSLRYGEVLLLCLLAPAALGVYREGGLELQLQQLLHDLTMIYDRAYGLGIFPLPEGADSAGVVDLPLALVGMMIVIAVCRCICRRKSLWLPVCATVLPLCSCIVVTDTVPRERWLFLVLAGLLLLILPQSVRRENMDQGNRLTAGAVLPVLLALAGLFLAFPQKDYVNQSAVLRENVLTALQNLPQVMEGGMNQIASGLQKQPALQVDLAGLGPRIPFTYPVMEVTAEQSGLLYLREQDYDLYDGRHWAATENREEAFCSPEGQTETIHIRTEYRKDIRYLPYHPESPVTLRAGRAENTEKMQEYIILRHRLPEDWRRTAYRNTDQSVREGERYLSLPEYTRREAGKLLEGLYDEGASNTEKADRIAAFTTETARYHLNPDTMPPSEPDFALWFLRESDSGYCIHFATAATVLLRAAGVPARYVTGYLVETAAGETVTATEEDAHAWAEYYEPNLGLWLPLEVTPAEETTVESAQPRPVPTDPTVFLETETAAPPQPAETVTVPTVPEPPIPERQEPEQPSDTKQANQMPLFLLMIPALLVLLALQRSARLALRWKVQHSGDPNRQALYRWREALRLSRLLKESPTEELIVLAQKAKFSQHALTAEELSLFDSFNRTCLRRLKERAWYLRLAYRYIYAAY